jgi:hypothetical protein
VGKFLADRNYLQNIGFQPLSAICSCEPASATILFNGAELRSTKRTTMALATTDTPRKAQGRTLSPDEFRRLTERTGVAQHVPTAEAAALLNVAPQTMRRWACEGSGPLRPIRVNGRLRWSVEAIAAVLSGSAQPAGVPA